LEKTQKKNRIILVLCSIFILIASIFSFIPLTNDTKIVNADSVDISYDFIGSNFTLPTYVMGLRQGTVDSYKRYGTSFINVSFSFNVSSSNSSVLTKQSTHVLSDDLNSTGDFEGDSFLVPKDNTYKYFSLYISELYYMEDGTLVGDDVYCDAIALCNSSSFNSNIKSIVFGSYLNYPLLDIPFTWFKYYNYVKYVDNNGNYILFAIVITNNDGSFDEITEPELFALDYRTYYIDQDISDTDVYNQGYEMGKLDGYNSGYSVGNTNGYDNGYKAGEVFGYNAGYSAGSEDSNQYTFLNLISATIDAPMTYFQKLFNFELLGVNLQGFLMALFTLCVVVTIVKLCLGK